MEQGSYFNLHTHKLCPRARTCLFLTPTDFPRASSCLVLTSTPISKNDKIIWGESGLCLDSLGVGKQPRLQLDNPGNGQDVIMARYTIAFPVTHTHAQSTICSYVHYSHDP